MNDEKKEKAPTLPAVSELGHRVYVPAHTWESLFVRFASALGDVIRAQPDQRAPMMILKSEKEHEPSKATLDVLGRWDETDVARAYALAILLKEGSDYETGGQVKRTNEELKGILKHGNASEPWPKVMRDVLDAQGWLERQSMGSSVGLKRASVYRLTVPASLLRLMYTDPDNWLPGSPELDKTCHKMISALTAQSEPKPAPPAPAYREGYNPWAEGNQGAA